MNTREPGGFPFVPLIFGIVVVGGFIITLWGLLA